MVKLVKYLSSYYGYILGAVALLFLQANCDLALPDYMSDIVNTGVMTGNTNYILKTGATMLLITLLGTAASVMVGYFAARTAAGVARDLRSGVFKKVEQFTHAEFDHFSTASLITRTTNDITQLQTVLVMMIRLVFYAPILGVGGVIKAISSSSSMSWIIGIAVLCLIGVVVILFIVVIPKFKLIQSLIDRLNLVARENIEGMLVIRAFNTQKFEGARFDKANRDLLETNLFVNRAMALMMPVMMLIMNLVTVIIVWVGAKHVSAFQMGIGDMMAYMQYAMQIIMAFLMMSMMFIMFPRAAVAADRIAEVLEKEESIADPEEPASFREEFQPTIEFRNVNFAYPGGEDAVLHNINFLAPAGQTTAIIGSTGSGKSTLLNLLMRFYDVTAGEILVDGQDIRTVTRRSLREKIGYIPQKSTLFSGSIRSNLSYGDKKATQETLAKAAEIAQATEFIAAKEEGYDSVIAQGGTNVSGGQRQRLSIARALVKNAPIYLFDDSFSALDLKTDRNLRGALQRETGTSTILLVAQRVSTIMNAEQIIVLDNGRIVGKGTHNELLQTCEVYQEIAYSQLSEEELAR
ncbi:ATP-binding cassette subfamily B protein [Desulfitobacterium sp. LBE]|uniref:Multidrug ABC transporter ATP-binding protein n=5 Tax=root TaxID=1 RepID=Q24Z28_DESHY|nr:MULTISPECIES: ABC transporter ATP-binding protein [Desulfitobacterium]ACL20051.1 ABC transporter related [Desulfitobacterium hafniense DCB-2]EHL05832.1 ABC transporter, ATP-binding protein [Desulfitobacterium hafniense DP7]KTE91722.1 multidrug ABC transporter ATP-binding protein [Desulfitobacterium hafniense]MEA5022919.1 ABC transporter ATP-binding protein [Desulfitobacterium hafniense]TWH57114.1 ATP-binding cassette subfamily B protein [Desulfitobacterium sp. LBE]